MSQKRTRTKKKKQRRVGCLIAFNLIRGQHLKRHGLQYWMTNLVDLLIDSGAFAAHRSGKPIDLDEYMGFLHEYHKHLFGYFALDVIGDAKKTNENLRIMHDNGLKPWPVFTVGNTQEDMERMFEHSDVVGVGGIMYKIWPYDAKSRVSYLKQVFEWAKGRKIHLLGVSQESILRTFQPFSCDTSTWLNAAKFGRLAIYQGNGRWTHLYSNEAQSEMQKKNREKITRDVELEITRAGFTLKHLTDTSLWNNKYETVSTEQSVLVHVTARSWIKYALEFEERFKTKIFIVIGGDALVDGKYPIPTQVRRLFGIEDPEHIKKRIKNVKRITGPAKKTGSKKTGTGIRRRRVL